MTLKSQRGASSILVILLLLVLIVLGIAALTASNANFRLGQKTIKWSKGYYLLEGRAEDLLFDTDALLIKAAETAADEESYFVKAARELDTLGYEVYTGSEGKLMADIDIHTGGDNGPRVLSITLQLHYPPKSKGLRFSIENWSVTK